MRGEHIALDGPLQPDIDRSARERGERAEPILRDAGACVDAGRGDRPAFAEQRFLRLFLLGREVGWRFRRQLKIARSGKINFNGNFCRDTCLGVPHGLRRRLALRQSMGINLTWRLRHLNTGSQTLGANLRSAAGAGETPAGGVQWEKPLEAKRRPEGPSLPSPRKAGLPPRRRRRASSLHRRKQRNR